ncbi:uroporphyrinogen-III synthase [Priestia koreensis]|uniref:uroporphyrinogen-III synthase n=1 Tax=Priestia koreensis TaxID=284581 RepID=UPI0028F71569|nr:uroporphyrinogen-III synthase [Priestia koreensis]
MNHAPLFSKKILITRGARQAKEMAASIEELGGVPVTVPLLKLQKPVQHTEHIHNVLQNLMQYTWLVFTSQNGVKFFFDFLDAFKIDKESMKHQKIAVVGEKTKRLLTKYGFTPTLVPTEFVAEKLLAELVSTLTATDKVLLVRGNLSRPVLLNGLKDHGIETGDLVVYETVPNEEVKEELVAVMKNGEIDAVTFTSSSSVRFFTELLQAVDWKEQSKRCIIVCIGPITERTAKKVGFTRCLTPQEYTTEGMIHLLVDQLSNERF